MKQFVLLAMVASVSACSTNPSPYYLELQEELSRADEFHEKNRREREDFHAGLDRCIKEAHQKFGTSIDARNDVEAYAYVCTRKYDYINGSPGNPAIRAARELYSICRSAGYRETTCWAITDYR
jgi:hypothetical protein